MYHFTMKNKTGELGTMSFCIGLSAHWTILANSEWGRAERSPSESPSSLHRNILNLKAAAAVNLWNDISARTWRDLIARVVSVLKWNCIISDCDRDAKWGFWRCTSQGAQDAEVCPVQEPWSHLVLEGTQATVSLARLPLSWLLASSRKATRHGCSGKKIKQSECMHFLYSIFDPIFSIETADPICLQFVK